MHRTCAECMLHAGGTQVVDTVDLVPGPRTPREHRAWFMAGGTALEIRGGLVVCPVVRWLIVPFKSTTPVLDAPDPISCRPIGIAPVDALSLLLLFCPVVLRWLSSMAG